MSPAAQNSASAGAAIAGRLRGGIRRAERKIAVVTQELVEEERARLIEERQGEVQRVLDRHDDLVRVLIIHKRTVLTLSRYAKAFIWKSLSPW